MLRRFSAGSAPQLGQSRRPNSVLQTEHVFISRVCRLPPCPGSVASRGLSESVTYPPPGCFAKRGCKLLKTNNGPLKKKAKRRQITERKQLTNSYALWTVIAIEPSGTTI